MFGTVRAPNTHFCKNLSEMSVHCKTLKLPQAFKKLIKETPTVETTKSMVSGCYHKKMF